MEVKSSKLHCFVYVAILAMGMTFLGSLLVKGLIYDYTGQVIEIESWAMLIPLAIAAVPSFVISWSIILFFGRRCIVVSEECISVYRGRYEVQRFSSRAYRFAEHKYDFNLHGVPLIEFIPMQRRKIAIKCRFSNHMRYIACFNVSMIDYDQLVKYIRQVSQKADLQQQEELDLLENHYLQLHDIERSTYYRNRKEQLNSTVERR